MKYLYLFISLSFIISCSGKNRVNLPEEALLASIENPDSSLLQLLASDPENVTVSTVKPGQQYTEERYKTAGYHPAIIDLSKNYDNIRPLTLSQVAHSIRYIRLKLPPQGGSTTGTFKGLVGGDTPSATWPFNITFSSNYILLSNIYGLYLYSKTGELLDTLYKNKVNVMLLGNMICWQPNVTVGIKPLVDETTQKIYLAEYNNEKQQFRFLEYKADFLSGTIYNQPKGEKNQPPMKLVQALPSKRQSFLFDLIQPGIVAAHTQSVFGMKKEKNFLTILSSKGDTLMSLKNNLDYKPFAANVTRGTDERISYHFNNNYTFMQEYNDTVFRLNLPNKLIPVFVLNFGDKKLQISDALNTKINTESKLHLNSFFENADYLLMKLVFGHDCFNQRKTGIDAFIGAYYNKKTGVLYFLPPGKVKLPKQLDLPNDIDGGLPFWPMATTADGKWIQWIDAEKYKQTLTDSWFAKSNAPENRKRAMKEFVNQLQPGELVLTIVE